MPTTLPRYPSWKHTLPDLRRKRSQICRRTRNCRPGSCRFHLVPRRNRVYRECTRSRRRKDRTWRTIRSRGRGTRSWCWSDSPASSGDLDSLVVSTNIPCALCEIGKEEIVGSVILSGKNRAETRWKVNDGIWDGRWVGKNSNHFEEGSFEVLKVSKELL